MALPDARSNKTKLNRGTQVRNAGSRVEVFDHPTATNTGERFSLDVRV